LPFCRKRYWKLVIVRHDENSLQDIDQFPAMLFLCHHHREARLFQCRASRRNAWARDPDNRNRKTRWPRSAITARLVVSASLVENVGP
jgi:hypothetical protein